MQELSISFSSCIYTYPIPFVNFFGEFTTPAGQVEELHMPGTFASGCLRVRVVCVCGGGVDISLGIRMWAWDGMGEADEIHTHC